MTHIGQIIEKELHRQERSVTWFARRLYCDRTNVYRNIFYNLVYKTATIKRIFMFKEHVSLQSFLRQPKYMTKKITH